MGYKNKQAGVYLITNQINGNCYIGSSTNLRKRLQEHRYCLRTNNHANLHLQNAFNKYGDIFTYEPIAFCSKEDTYYFEDILIKLLKPEYNILKTPGTAKGFIHSEETKHKISEKHKGRKHTEESIRNMSKGQKERCKNPSELQRLSDIAKGNNNWLGRKHTPEACEKISLVKQGNKNCLGQKRSEESRQKMRESRLAYLASKNVSE